MYNWHSYIYGDPCANETSILTRNAFCRTWCLPRVIMTDTVPSASFLLPVWNLTSPSCSATPLSYVTRELRRFGLAYLYLHGYSGPFGPKWRFWVQNRGRGGAMLTSNEVVLLMLGVVTSLPLLSIKECDHESADRQTDRHRLWQRFCPMLYAIANGAHNKNVLHPYRYAVSFCSSKYAQSSNSDCFGIGN